MQEKLEVGTTSTSLHIGRDGETICRENLIKAEDSMEL
jgi:hypothetical protein